MCIVIGVLNGIYLIRKTDKKLLGMCSNNKVRIKNFEQIALGILAFVNREFILLLTEDWIKFIAYKIHRKF